MSIRALPRLPFVPLLVALVAACGGDDDTTTPDTDSDASSDAGDTTTDTDPGDGSSANDGSSAPDTDGGTDTTPDEQIRVPGMDAAAQVRFDARGVPHIRCNSDTDCAAAIGYLHARDRFLQMDIRRRLVRGQLSALVNDSRIIELDVANRRLYSAFDGTPLEEQVLAATTPEVRAQLDAYTNGVNAWIDDLNAGRNGATIAREYTFPIVNAEIARWSTLDSIAGVLALVESLINLSGDKIFNGEVAAALEPDAAFDLFGLAPPSLATTYGSFEETFSGPSDSKFRLPPSFALDPAVHERLRPARRALSEAHDALARTFLSGQFPEPGSTGSNNWVVSPSRSATGNALLANDPHLALSNPAIWYLAHIESESGLHTTGVTFAGLPWVILGQNETLAWGATASYLDLTDVYVETLTEDGSGVVFRGEDVPFIRRNHEFTLGDGTTTTRELLFVPHHGPVLSIDEEAGTAVTLRWAAQDIGSDINVIFGLNTAATVEEGREVLLGSNTLGQNWVLADTEGNIGWFPYNRIPLRTWADADTPNWLPLPGDGSAEWEEFWAYEDIPQAFNPAAGVVATANNDMTGALADGNPLNDGYPPIQFSVAEGFRQERIINQLQAVEQHSVASMHALQGDVYMQFADATVAALLADAEARSGDLTESQARLVTALENWDFTCPTGLATSDAAGDVDPDPARSAASAGCLVFHLVINDLRYATYDDESDAWPGYPSYTHMAIALSAPERLRAPDAYWDDVSTADVTETRSDMLLRALTASATWLETEYGTDPADWRWGREHTLSLRADLFDQFGVDIYNSPAYANDGGLFTVDVANILSARTRDFGHTAGASMRFVCDMQPAGAACSIQLPGGQVHDRNDATWLGFFQEYLSNTPYPLSMDFDAVTGGPAITIEPGDE